MTALQRTRNGNGGALSRTPFRLLDEMMRDFGDLGFGRFDAFDAPSFEALGDIEETDDGWLFTCDMPGVRAEDIQLTLDGDVVRIHAERKTRGRTTVIDRAYTVKGVDGEKAEARCEDGVLTLRLPKSEAAKPRVIPVRLPELQTRGGGDGDAKRGELAAKQDEG